jgi:hypothetical protein
VPDQSLAVLLWANNKLICCTDVLEEAVVVD